MTRTRPLAAIAVIAMLLAPGAARAGTDDPARMGVYVYAGAALSEPERAEVQVRVRSGAAAAAGFEVIELVGEGGPDRDARAESALARGDRALTEGTDAARHFEHSEALERLEWAVEEYAQYLPALMVRDGNAGRLVEAYVQVAAVQFLEGEEALADEALRYALVLQPELEAAADRIPPQMHDFVQTRQFLIEELGRGALRVEADGGAPTVYVNGIDRGRAPVVVEELVPGPNFVHLQAGRTEPVFLAGPVEGRGTVSEVRGRVEPPASTDLVGLAGTREAVGRGTVPQVLHDAAEEAGTDALLLVIPIAAHEGMELGARVYDMRSGRLAGRAEVSASAEDLAARAEELGRVAVSGAEWRPLVTAGGDGPPLWRRVRDHEYFWPAVGVTTGVVVVGAVLLAADRGLSPGQKVGILPVIEF